MKSGNNSETRMKTAPSRWVAVAAVCVALHPTVTSARVDGSGGIPEGV